MRGILIPSRAEADLATLSGANWTNVIALDGLVVTMPLGATIQDSATRVQRCINTVITSLPRTLFMTTITIRNPLPISVVQEQDNALTSELAPILHELDVFLGKLIAAGTLLRVAFATSRPYTRPLAENEKLRVDQLFPILAELQDTAV